jgi:hypothetical protein
MKRIKKMVQLMLLALGTLVVLATSDPGPGGFGVTDSWIVSNIYDGQTAVPQDITINLTIGSFDFQEDGEISGGRTRQALEEIRLYPEDDPSDLVALDFDIADETTVIRFDMLASDTWYVLDLTGMDVEMTSDRDLPDPLYFRTGSAPQVTDIFRNEDTLFIVFSEPMDPDTLDLSHSGVDILWQEDDELHSIVYSLNLADFAYDAEARLFRLAPVTFLDDVWIKVSGNVRGESGVYLDGNRNDIPGEVGDDYIAQVDIMSLDTCVTREDIPSPCVAHEDVPDNWSWDFY